MKTLFVTAVLLVAAAPVLAQQPAEVCVTNRNAPPVSAYYWPPDTDVKVFFVGGMFSPEQRATLFAAMKTWSNSNSQTGAGVTFSFAGDVNEPVRCKGCLTVTRRDVYKHERKRYALFNPLQQDESGLLVSAWIDFDFATTNPEALEGYMAHELGHGLGLWDCKSCQKKKTIMNAFPGVNDNNGLVAPSKCDLEVIRQVYELQRQVDKNSAPNAAAPAQPGGADL